MSAVRIIESLEQKLSAAEQSNRFLMSTIAERDATVAQLEQRERGLVANIDELRTVCDCGCCRQVDNLKDDLQAIAGVEGK